MNENKNTVAAKKVTYKLTPMPLKTLLEEIGDGIQQYYLNRFAGNWDSKAPSALYVSVFNSIHIGNIYTAEVGSNTILFDGKHRTYYLKNFRFGNARVDKKTENSVITYKRRKINESGKFEKDENGNFIFEDAEFDIAGHTFEELPKELQNQFDKTTISVITYENCTNEDVNKLIRVVNNHTAMNQVQKAFTRVNNFGMQINEIGDEYIFRDCFSTKDRIKGNLQKIVMDSIMLIFHTNDWKTNALKEAEYINEHSSEEELNYVSEINKRLCEINDGEMEFIFEKKNAAIWFALFSKFDDIENDDEKFKEFVKEFKKTLVYKEIDGTAFCNLDRCYTPEVEANSKMVNMDKKKTKSTVTTKLNYLTKLMYEYFGVEEEIETEIEEVSMETTENNEVSETVEEVKKAEIIEESGYYTTTDDETDNTYDEEKFLSDDYYKLIKDSGTCWNFSMNDVVEIGNKTMALFKNVSIDELKNMTITDDDYLSVISNLEVIDEEYGKNVDLSHEFFTVDNIVALIRIAQLACNEGYSDFEVEKWFCNYIDAYKAFTLAGLDYIQRYEVLKKHLERHISFHSKTVEIPMSQINENVVAPVA